MTRLKELKLNFEQKEKSLRKKKNPGAKCTSSYRDVRRVHLTY